MRFGFLIAALWVTFGTASEQNAPLPRLLASEHLENLFSIQDKVFSGSSPDDESGFLELKKLGVKTIISVDGSKPDVETARKHGFRYIHIPMGYDGTTVSNANRILKAAERAEGPVYVHCHHGKHRGPAAVAVICEGFGMWSTNEAVAWMKQAGTSPDYPGLFKMAVEFKKLAPSEYGKIATNFPEQAKVSGLVDAMVEIDERWDRLKAVQKAGCKVPPAHPDLVPATEAVLLKEAFRELQRLEDAKKLGADFLSRLEAAEREAAEVHSFLKNADKADVRAAEGLWSKVSQSCAACHKKYRN